MLQNTAILGNTHLSYEGISAIMLELIFTDMNNYFKNKADKKISKTGDYQDIVISDCKRGDFEMSFPVFTDSH